MMHFFSIQFVNTWAWWLFIIPALMLLWHLKKADSTPTITLSNTSAFSKQTSFKILIRRALPYLRILTVVFLIIAIARPQSASSEEKSYTNGIDITLAMDVSSSMLEKDFSPNRLEAAKEVASAFVKQRPNDRIGIVVFSGESFTQCPNTIDHGVVQRQLAEIQNGALEDGTAIGMGIATSVRMMRKSDAKSRVIILLTDGVNTAGTLDPMTAVEIAKTFKVKIYCIGIGTNTGDLMGIDEPLMKKIASQTGGLYWSAGSKEKLKRIYDEINKLETTAIEVNAFTKKTDRFFPFAIVAFALFCVEIIAKYLLVKSIP